MKKLVAILSAICLAAVILAVPRRAASAAVVAVDSMRVEGVVTDTSHKPIEGVRVVGEHNHTVTDSKGTFAIWVRRGGEVLLFEHNDYASVETETTESWLEITLGREGERGGVGKAVIEGKTGGVEMVVVKSGGLDKDASHYTGAAEAITIVDDMKAVEATEVFATFSERNVVLEEAVVEGAGESRAESRAYRPTGQSLSDNPGTLTAGEWNDLRDWEQWRQLVEKEHFNKMPDYWGFHTDGRVRVEVAAKNGEPVPNAAVVLMRGKEAAARARTNNKGVAELWVEPWHGAGDVNGLSLLVDGVRSNQSVVPFKEGVNRVVAGTKKDRSTVQVAFMVDATGSMSDEMEFLKSELVDVVRRVESVNEGRQVVTATVFYRDRGDTYVTRMSQFTPNEERTAAFIKAQHANGGGDFPEAVHTAMRVALSELDWDLNNSHARIMFMLLDAPPHHDEQVLTDLRRSMDEAMRMGIRLVPIVASGIDKPTEYLMRSMALLTNGTYVFITDHSGVGRSHLEASVGQFAVEKLNDLLVRIINEFSMTQSTTPPNHDRL